jgi:hypothetical protein
MKNLVGLLGVVVVIAALVIFISDRKSDLGIFILCAGIILNLISVFYDFKWRHNQVQNEQRGRPEARKPSRDSFWKKKS